MHVKAFEPLGPVARLLMGPGPSNVHPRVYGALSAPVVGHLDPQFVRIMEETKELLREAFQTTNELTLPISGTGSAGMETCFVNAVEPGDRVVVGINGVFGQRMRDVAERCGAEVTAVEAPWGSAIDPQAVAEAVAAGPCKLVAVVHAETSTGVLQPLEAISQIVGDSDALFLVDTVTSLGGVPVAVDEWGVDLCYSGTQKCLSCPPGLAPVTVSERARAAMANRREPAQSWYLDLSMIQQYWGEERVYHHTAPVSMNYALREALLLIHEEGLHNRWERHRANHLALVRGLTALGLELLVSEEIRLPTLTTVKVPEGVDEAAVRRQLLDLHNIELGAGLGEFRGRAWRVGLMGHTATMENVVHCLAALEAALEVQGHHSGPGAVRAAIG
ncbi:pyridoxal-phosphate-dependent aminotransferase family protein [Candidatus Latescibacterota bacterium]